MNVKIRDVAHFLIFTSITLKYKDIIFRKDSVTSVSVFCTEFWVRTLKKCLFTSSLKLYNIFTDRKVDKHSNLFILVTDVVPHAAGIQSAPARNGCVLFGI